ncbi:transposable element Tc1 transposase [Trichonephila clavipes]|uniref:Transposable element Tc1 transposase n=1 Tax=Trichonephila clavipes TaxID=2585209 RepID=A0A8X6UY95_TRICX|nr:transposable element Tc1 transposase [Trichonephila clavipes]
MPLRRRRSHYQQITEFEQGHVIELRESGFRVGRNVSTVFNCWEQWSRYVTASRRPGSGWTRGTTEMEDYRIRCTAEMHRTAPVAEIRAAVGNTKKDQRYHSEIYSEDNMLYKDQIKITAFCDVWMMTKSAVSVEFTVGYNHCHKPRHGIKEALNVSLGYSSPCGSHI